MRVAGASRRSPPRLSPPPEPAAPLGAEDIALRAALGGRQAEHGGTARRLGRAQHRHLEHRPGSGVRGAPGRGARARLDFQVTVEPERAARVSLTARTRAPARWSIAERKATVDPSSARHFLLLGHSDTVFEPRLAVPEVARSIAASPDRAYGPGSSDMKGGLVVLLEAPAARCRQRRPARAPNVTVLLNADEEIGSLGSRARIQAAAARCAARASCSSPRSRAASMARSRSGAASSTSTRGRRRARRHLADRGPQRRCSRSPRR